MRRKSSLGLRLLPRTRHRLCGRDTRRRRKMAIRLGVAGRPRRRLAHLEQFRGCGTMARLVINRAIAGGTVWPRMGLLSLPRIFSAGAVGPGGRVCSTSPQKGGRLFCAGTAHI